jgi:hypothetical protein
MTRTRWSLILALAAMALAPAALAASRSDAPRIHADAVQIPSVSPPSNEDRLVVPGQRAGKLTLGMSAQQVLDIMGPPAMAAAIGWVGGVSEYRWPHASVFLRDSDQKVIEISLSDVAYHIDGGLTFDSTRAQVLAAYGRPDMIWHMYNREHYWWRTGISMTFTTTDDTVNSLQVCAHAGVCN